MKNVIYKSFAKISMIIVLSTTSISALNFSHSSTNSYNFIYASGKIKRGDSYRLKNQYRKVNKRKQTIVVFDSEGGELSAGLKLGKYIKKHHIGTAVYQNSLCASSCALAFLGGRDLYGRKLMILPYSSKLGFHSYYYKNPERVSKRTAYKDYEKVVNYFNYVRASKYLLSKMLHTGSHEMYWITQDNKQYLRNLKIGLDAKKHITNYKKSNSYILSKKEHIKNYFQRINNIIRSSKGYRNKQYIALNYNSYNNWISKHIKQADAVRIKELNGNYVKVKAYYKLENNVRVCTNNTYKLSPNNNGWKVTYKKITPCGAKSRKYTRGILDKLP